MHRKLLAAAAIATIGTAACSDTALEPRDHLLTTDEFAALTASLDAVTANLLDAVMLGFGVPGSVVIFQTTPGSSTVPIENVFNLTRPCPAGGEVVISGRTTGEADRATRTLATETVATRREVACAFPQRGGGTVTIDGDPHVELRDSRKMVNGLPSGPQVQSQKGAYTYRTSDGRSGSCQIDVTSTFDLAAGTMTMRGTNCGRTIDVTRRRGG